MVTRRALLGTTATVMGASTAGCLDMVPFIGDEPIEFSATQASVPRGVLEDTGYTETNRQAFKIERTFEAAGQTQGVIVTNHRTEYAKAVDFGETVVPIDRRVEAAVFTVLSTPQVTVLGRTFNPVADMDSEALAELIQNRYDGIENVSRVGDRDASVAGTPATVGEFEAQAELVEAGVAVDLTLHVAEAVESGDDLLVALGGYPKLLREREVDPVFTMMAGIEHPT